MDACRSTLATGVHQEDIVEPVEAAKAGLEASVVPPITESNVVPTTAEPSAVVLTTIELPSSVPAAPSTDMTRGPQ